MVKVEAEQKNKDIILNQLHKSPEELKYEAEKSKLETNKTEAKVIAAKNEA
jgi:hypothetical protein